MQSFISDYEYFPLSNVFKKRLLFENPKSYL